MVYIMCMYWQEDFMLCARIGLVLGLGLGLALGLGLVLCLGLVLVLVLILCQTLIIKPPKPVAKYQTPTAKPVSLQHHCCNLCLLVLQASLFIIFGICGLLVQTVLLRTLLSWFSESRVLVIGELPTPEYASNMMV